MLNGLGTERAFAPQAGATRPGGHEDLADLGRASPSIPWGRTDSSTVSARKDFPHWPHRTSGSVKFSRWPDARTTASGKDLRRFDPVVILGKAEEPGRPGLLDLPLERGPEGPVVVESLDAPVDLGRWPEVAASAEQRKELVQVHATAPPASPLPGRTIRCSVARPTSW